MSLCCLTDWKDGLQAGDLSAAFLARTCLDRITRADPHLNAITYLNPSLTLQAAHAADQRLQQGERGPMLGMPVILKDNLHWEGTPVQHGSSATQGYAAPYNATVVQRLLDAGAVPIAKANMDEFAMGSSGEHSAQGATRNPWDQDRTPGGSSSGSIVSVAAGYAPFALGSDTGGSVRLPGSFCNVTALRPTYGVLSRFGVTAMASSLDQVGPVATRASDLAAGMSVLVGQDPLDATSIDLPQAQHLASLQPLPLQGLRIGLPKEYFSQGLAPGVKTALNQAIRTFESAGSTVVDLSLPTTSYAIETYYLICTAEVSSNMSRFDGIRYGFRAPSPSLDRMIAETRDQGFGPEVKRRILLGAFCLSKGYYDAFYLKALKARTLIAQDFEAAFRHVDFILTPVSPDVAFKLGEKSSDPMAMYLTDVFTVTSALAAMPCMTLPAGFAAPQDNPAMQLPVGMQLIGPPLSDVRLLALAHAFQQITDHHLQTPPLSDPGL